MHMINEIKKWQISCKKCNHVRSFQTNGLLTESEKKCEKCGEPIDSTNICEVKQEFLLE